MSSHIDQPIIPPELRERVEGLFKSKFLFRDEPDCYHVGGFGFVFKVVCKGTGEVVALKLPGVSFLASGDLRASATMCSQCEPNQRVEILSNEIDCLQKLKELSPPKEGSGLENVIGIPRILESGSVEIPGGSGERMPFFTTKWFEYGTLSETHQTCKTEERWIGPARLIARLARTVAALHRCPRPTGSAGYVHRDIKPSNVMFATAARDVPILIDYGLCIPHDDGVSRGLVGELRPAGTVLYMSPEQVAGKIGTRSDVFSLGLLLFQLVSGHLPWVGLKDESSEADVLRVIKECKANSLDEIVIGVPAELNRICDLALKKNPEDRPSATRLAKMLEDFVYPRLPFWVKVAAGLAATATLTAATYLSGFFGLISQPNQNSFVASPPPISRNQADDQSILKTLAQVEHNLLSRSLSEGAAAHDNLAAYYFAANPDFTRRFQGSLNRFRAGNSLGGLPAATKEAGRTEREKREPAPPRMMTLVSGSAGVGKSFIVRPLRDQWPKGTAIKVDIRTDLYEGAWADKVEMRPDLSVVVKSVGGQAERRELLSSMPALKTKEGPSLKSHLEGLAAKGVVFILIDSLDEIHPDDSIRHLKDIYSFVFDGNHPFVHVAVFARPEAFWEYWNIDSGPKQSAAAFDWLSLNPPQYATTGDLSYSNLDFDTYHLELRKAGKPMSLTEYVQWEKAGYPLDGAWHTVSYRNSSLVKKPIDLIVRGRLRDWAKKEPFLVDAIENLDSKNELLSAAGAGEVFSERTTLAFLQDLLFSQRLGRGTKTHGRPATGETGAEVYKKLLQAIAVKYAPQVEQDGCFWVGTNDADKDMITVTHEGIQRKVFAWKVLDRSGLALLEPPNGKRRRYRFDPIWVHAYLYKQGSAN